MRAVLVLVALLGAGCLLPVTDTSGAAVTVLNVGGSVLEADAQRGAVSTLRLVRGDAADIEFPEGFLVKDADGRFVPATGALRLGVDSPIEFLAPYGEPDAWIRVGGHETHVPIRAAREALVSGEFAVAELARQRDQFPHRTPGMPSYKASQAYFADFFRGLGYEVEVDPYGVMALDGVKLPAGPQPGPSSVANVVAFKRGTLNPERYLIVGGHYDVVEGTREGAFDNTAGTVATMAFARALANVTTRHTIVFGLWGGEEDGILGSQFWVTTNPDKIARMDGYFNFDVTSLAYPAPKVDPAPLIIAAGPDGASAQTLHGHARHIEEAYLRSGAPFVYEGVVQGQALGPVGMGGGVNAQSDHAPFVARGVPSYFTFSARVGDIRSFIHRGSDSLDNMTAYALHGIEGVGQTLTPEEVAEGEWYLARSFETQMYLALYWALLTDADVLSSPKVLGGAR